MASGRAGSSPRDRRHAEHWPEHLSVTSFGKTFTKDDFGNWFRDRCDEAGLPKCTAHGLRKAIARRMAQSRASDAEMMAVGGWRSISEVCTYTLQDAEVLGGEMIGQADHLWIRGSDRATV